MKKRTNSRSKTPTQPLFALVSGKPPAKVDLELHNERRRCSRRMAAKPAMFNEAIALNVVDQTRRGFGAECAAGLPVHRKGQLQVAGSEAVTVTVRWCRLVRTERYGSDVVPIFAAGLAQTEASDDSVRRVAGTH